MGGVALFIIIPLYPIILIFLNYNNPVTKIRIIKIIILIISLIIFIFYPFGIVLALIGFFLNLLIKNYLLEHIVKAINELKKCILHNKNTFLNYFGSFSESKKFTLYIIFTILFATTMTAYYLYYTYDYSAITIVDGDDDDDDYDGDDDDDDDDDALPIDYFKPFDHVIIIHYAKSINKWIVEDEIIRPSFSAEHDSKTYNLDSEYGNLLIEQSTHSINIYRKIDIEFNESYFGLSKINSLILDNYENLRSILLHSIRNILRLNNQEDVSNVEYGYYLRSSKVTINVPKFMIGTTYPPIESRFDLLDGGKEELILSLNSFEFKRALSLHPEIRLEVINPLLRNELLYGLHKLHYLNFLKWLILGLALIFGSKIRELFIEPIVTRLLKKIKSKQ